MNVTALCLLSLAFVHGDLPDLGANEFGPQPTWQAATAPQVREQVIEWLAAQSIDEPVRTKIEAEWPPGEKLATPTELLDRLAETFAEANTEARALVKSCGRPYPGPPLPKYEWLSDARTPAFMRNNLRLFHGRWLAQHNLYQEALASFNNLGVEDVVDPASLLFYRAIAHHQLVNIEECQEAVQRLLERENELPRRYQQLARLMHHDVEAVEVDSLDHIARRMDDIGRRLDLGRAGKKVRHLEDGVIASLDKLIKKLEEQAKGQSGGASSAGGGGQPMKESRIGRMQAPGKVDRKDIGGRAGWGSLPPKQREEALQQIGQHFPAHFRDVIEQYFRRIASEENTDDK